MSSSNTDTLGVELDTAGGAEANMLPDAGNAAAGAAPKMLPEELAKVEVDDDMAGELPNKSSIPSKSTLACGVAS
jgi:hypothetical protein